MSLKSAARRGGIASVAALSAFALASCSAGQITQTSSQVSHVDGGHGDSEDGTVAVRDVSIILDEEGGAALKFNAINQDSSMQEHTLESVEVAGQEVEFSPTPAPMQQNCSIVGHSAAGLEEMPQFENGCIEYVETTLENEDYAIAGNVDVTFTFENAVIDLVASVAFDNLESGTLDRDDQTDTNSDNNPSLGEQEH
ncbi:hypothetical protein COCCU_11925 [Corynebacterium occultum]|uniref:Lipoprotein LpqE n=2 Tax=Corynebacterium occultum TaxID=2675219 RepID=A0A6B8WAH5_9CORY|nr:hypothetical protein COCCU_11925 [Corynebacterium occultum]